jgi:hypothetical protein
MENQQNSNKKMVYLLVVFFAVFAGTGLFLMGRGPSELATKDSSAGDGSAIIKQDNMVIPTSAPTVGSISITGEETYPLSDNLVIGLSASSNDENVVGYDVVLYYDPEAFEFVAATSTLPDFTIYPKDNKNYLFLTAVKSVGVDSTTVLGNEASESAIANLTFKPLKTGNYNFSLRQSAEEEKTQLVTDQTEVLNPALSDLAVEITDELTTQ